MILSYPLSPFTRWSAVIIRAAADIDDAEIAAWRAVSDRAPSRPFQIPVQIPILCVVTVTERGVQLQAVILYAHGMIRTGDNVEPGYSRVDLPRHPVFKSRLWAEISQRMLHHPRRIPVVIPGDVLVPRHRLEHDLADLIEESPNHIRGVLRRHSTGEEGLIHGDCREDERRKMSAWK